MARSFQAGFQVVRRSQPPSWLSICPAPWERPPCPAARTQLPGPSHTTPPVREAPTAACQARPSGLNGRGHQPEALLASGEKLCVEKGNRF